MHSTAAFEKNIVTEHVFEVRPSTVY